MIGNRLAICSILTLALCGAMVFWALGGVQGPRSGDEYKPEVSHPVDVAPQAAGSRAQTWASVAWSPGAKGWLVAWREGCLNEGTTEVWCARISEEGKPLDTAGTRLAAGEGLRGDVKVASDGRNWLVVWGELSKKQDWDVRGVLVGPEGKPMGEPFLIAGGEHNQCQPAVAFAGGHYHVVWSAFVGSGLPNTPGNGYALFGVRISPQGKLLDSTPNELVSNRGFQASHPSIAAGEDVLAVTFVEQVHSRWGGTVINRVLLDAQTGRPKHGPLPPIKDVRVGGRALGNKVTARWCPVAWGGGSFLTSVRHVESFGGGDPYLATLWTLSSTGSLETTKTSLHGLGQARVSYVAPHTALAYDGEHFLYLMESPRDAGRPGVTQMCIAGWYVSPDGKKIVCGSGKGGFLIASEAGKEHILPAVAPGPKGLCLVVNSELRGMENLKLVARLVRLRRATP